MGERSKFGGSRLFRLMAVALLSALVACAGRQPADLQSRERGQGGIEDLEQGFRDILPALPQPVEFVTPEPIPRDASVIYTWRLSGEECFSKNELAVRDLFKHRMELMSTDQEEAWAIYQFQHLLPEDTPKTITLTLAQPIPARYFVLLPDYSAEIWEWQVVETTETSFEIDLGSWPSLVSPDGSVYIAIIGWGNQPTIVSEVKLVVDLIGPAPQFVQASDGEFPDKVAVVWDEVPTATQYVVFRNGQNEENIIAQIDAEEHGYDDFDATNLDEHTYWVRAKFLDEFGRFSQSDTGYRNGWHRYSIDMNGIVGLYASMAVIDGIPSLSYFDFSNGNLKYARALTSMPESSADWQIHIVDFNNQVGELTSLAVLDGKPIISYFDNALGNLKFARAITATPEFATDWRYHAVDSEGWVGEYNSLAVVNGLPAISYYDYTKLQLKYARALTDAPSSAADWQTHAVDISGQTGRFTSLAEVGGNPAISYYGDGTTDLRYARSIISEPSSRMDWRLHIVDGEIDVGLYTSMALLGDLPMISYYDWSAKTLKFALAQTVAPGSGADWTTHNMIAEDTICLYPSLQSFNGRPVLSFYGNGDLYYSRALTSSPVSIADWQTLPVDASGAAGNYSSLVILNDLPAIAYFGNPGLMFASAP